MSYTDHRNRLLEAMEEGSIAICYAGQEPHANEDDYYDLIVNSQFYWLTGLERAGMILALTKIGGKLQAKLFIDEADPFTIRWTGRMPSKEDAAAVSGMSVEDILYTSQWDGFLSRFMSRNMVKTVYFDVWKCSRGDQPHYNALQADAFLRDYPGVQLIDLHNTISPLRSVKDAEEIELIRQAADITRQGLEFVMKNLKPGRYEYQVQADFEYQCRLLGMKRLAFHTIAGAGPNGCMMHYVDNDRKLAENDMILLDLGAAYKNYCSDVTRTYPASGRYTARQRQFYDLVLKANKAITAAAKPGVTTADLQKVARTVLGEGLVEMGMIENAEQVDKYYMHGCSHSIGIDVHDINVGSDIPLEPGWVISNEPGLYIDEEEIGIRIEDDLLITEDGCEVLTADIIREADAIEAYMAAHRA